MKIDRSSYRQDFDQKGDGALETEHREAENWRKNRQIDNLTKLLAPVGALEKKNKTGLMKVLSERGFQPILPWNHQYQTDYWTMVYATAKYNNITGLWSWLISNVNHSHHFRLHHHRHYCLSLPHPLTALTIHAQACVRAGEGCFWTQTPPSCAPSCAWARNQL